jgi:hypothetical protein
VPLDDLLGTLAIKRWEAARPFTGVCMVCHLLKLKDKRQDWCGNLLASSVGCRGATWSSSSAV